MPMMHRVALIALSAGFALSGCSGAAGSLTPASSTASDALLRTEGGGRGSGNTAAGIGALSAMSSLVLTYSDENAGEPTTVPKGGLGKCHFGHEFFSPDKAGTPNSTETIDFYEPACVHIARVAVRIWTPASASSETVARTVANFSLGSSTPRSVREETTRFSNATFGAYGFPILADGFDRETSSTLTVGDVKKTVISDSESVMLPSTSNVNDYCTDSAGYNAVGVPILDLSYGWQGGAFSGATRTLNSNGSLTWRATHTGTAQEAPIGAFSIAIGAYNTACPITAPAYALDGGTLKGNYTIPVSLTYYDGDIQNVTIANATLANTYALNVTTDANVPPSSLNFIQGTVAENGTTLATFDVNAFGTGTLTNGKNGHVFLVVNWSVIR